MTTSNRPKRVVVVDADNPTVEIHGEFFWREDHDVLVAAARETAFREGYDAGRRDGHRGNTGQTVVLRRRRSLPARVRRVVWRLVLLALSLIVLATIGNQLMAQR